MRKFACVTLVALLLLLTSACLTSAPTQGLATPLPPVPAVSPQITPPADPPVSNGLPAWLQVYFTNPDPPDQVGSGIDRVAIQAVESAAHSVDVTSFDFNLPRLVNALTDAANHGVQVRVVLDLMNGAHELRASESPTGRATNVVKVLSAGGIKVVDGGRSSGLMHNKMIIIDGKTLIMGSWNMSYNDTFRNNNNMLVITDPQLIANYQAKFDELYVDKHFGAKSVVGALQPELTLNGVQVENYFSPPDHVSDKLVAYVKAARSSVRFMIYTFTDAALADALVERLNAGVSVEGVIENREAAHGVLPALFCANLPVKTDGNPYTMHHKVIIIDESTVITGSFNFTKSADKYNDENLLVIHSPAVAALYLQEFDRVNGIGNIPNPADIDCSKIYSSN